MSHLDAAQTNAAGVRSASWASARAFRLSPWQTAWIGFAVLVLASFLPLRFSATTTLVFDVGAQPPAAAVRGVAQVLSSRELAYDAASLLSPEDVRRIATGGVGGWFGFARRDGEGRSPAIGAAWRLMEQLEVEPEQGGRALRLSVSAPTPALAVRAADAYISAFLSLDRDARSGQGEAPRLPQLRRGEAGRAFPLPNPPGPLALGLLAAAAVLLVIARRHWSAAPQTEGPVEGTALPVELAGTHRIAWIGGPEGGGIDLADAVDRLLAQIGPPGRDNALIVLTSDALHEASATCAVDLARRLSEDAGVALVALDGAAESLAALVSDPWAPGMSELLFGVAGFGETIHRDVRSRAHVIPPGRDALSGPAVVGAERLALVLEALKRTYDFVVVAAPSLAGARSGHSLAGLDPLVVCLNPDDAPPTAAVESFDALADKRFARVVMVCLATGIRTEADAPEHPAALPPPSLEAEPAEPERLAGAA
ncbi:hypothetical protein ABLE93_07635 [Xanthobacter sp. KR7-65]|uniref:hypothetical protein n=1 Tax=Xanthobacter sp. KR7-65 TaxID=3156612 RepID=UPI0032B58B58